ncbi:MAG TPA: family 16 glycosylhydrolase [Panacibacter sp.]|nr:family 16 glycosylhydrolase [Panacibacter sp.]HNP45829.1 family 16 glycosylhydrolase [Panacibacter sp.]
MNKKSSIFIYALVAVAFAACSKGGDGGSTPPASTITATITGASTDRSVSGSSITFNVALSAAPSADVSLHYASLATGNAVAGKDYTAVEGTLVIPAGTKSGSIKVDVSADSLRQPNQTFQVQLSDAKNCSIKTDKATGTIINENGLYFPVDNTGYTTPDNYSGYTLAWSDEFNGNAVNTADWTFEAGNNMGWGNAELENYTDRTQNAFVSKGNLIIEARREEYGGSQYTSTRMITKNKKTFKFGRVDIRAKLPSTKGIWPALWMLGNNIDAVGWPACGEIDIMELLGQEPGKMYSTLHWGANVASHDSKGTNYVLPSGTFDQQFHVFSLVWQQDDLKFLVDDTQVFEGKSSDVAGNPYPFNSDFFFIFNIAVGGNWPGAPDNTTVFPQRMVVDYVRVFQK